MPGGKRQALRISQLRNAIYHASFWLFYASYKNAQSSHRGDNIMQLRAVEPFLHRCIEWHSMLEILAPGLRSNWLTTASKAWSGTLRTIAGVSDVSRIDMDLLISLKDLVPDLQCHNTRIRLLAALNNVFRLALLHPEWMQQHRQELRELAHWQKKLTTSASGYEDAHQGLLLAIRMREQTNFASNVLEPTPAVLASVWQDKPSTRTCDPAPEPTRARQHQAVSGAQPCLGGISPLPPGASSPQRYKVHFGDSLLQNIKQDIRAAHTLAQASGPVRAAVVCTQCVSQLSSIPESFFPLKHRLYLREQMMPTCLKALEALAGVVLQPQLCLLEPDDYDKIIPLLQTIHTLTSIPKQQDEPETSSHKIRRIYSSVTEQALLYLSLQIHMDVDTPGIKTSLIFLKRLVQPETARLLGHLTSAQQFLYERQLQRLACQHPGQVKCHPGYQPPDKRLEKAFRQKDLPKVASLLFQDKAPASDPLCIRLLGDLLMQQLLHILYNPTQQLSYRESGGFRHQMRIVEKLAAFARQHALALDHIPGLAEKLSSRLNSHSTLLLATWNKTGTGLPPDGLDALMHTLTHEGWLDSTSAHHWQLVRDVAAATGNSTGGAIKDALRHSREGNTLKMADALRPLLAYQPLLEDLLQAHELRDQLACAQRRLYRETCLRVVLRWKDLSSKENQARGSAWCARSKTSLKHLALSFQPALTALNVRYRNNWLQAICRLWSEDLLSMTTHPLNQEADFEELQQFVQLVPDLGCQQTRLRLKLIMSRILERLAEHNAGEQTAESPDRMPRGYRATVTRLCAWAEKQLKYDQPTEAEANRLLLQSIGRCRHAARWTSAEQQLLTAPDEPDFP